MQTGDSATEIILKKMLMLQRAWQRARSASEHSNPPEEGVTASASEHNNQPEEGVTAASEDVDLQPHPMRWRGEAGSRPSDGHRKKAVSRTEDASGMKDVARAIFSAQPEPTAEIARPR